MFHKTDNLKMNYFENFSQGVWENILTKFASYYFNIFRKNNFKIVKYVNVKALKIIRNEFIKNFFLPFYGNVFKVIIHLKI